MNFASMASVGLQLYSASRQKNAADKAAGFAKEIGEENAKIIERDIDLADRKIEILNRTLALSNERKNKAFASFQGKGIAMYGAGGTDLSRGAPITVARQSAAEFEYELAIDAYNTSIAVLELEDSKTETAMRAKVSRMGGQAQASAYGSKGTTALITGLGGAITSANYAGMFSADYWSGLTKSFSEE